MTIGRSCKRVCWGGKKRKDGVTVRREIQCEKLVGALHDEDDWAGNTAVIMVIRQQSPSDGIPRPQSNSWLCPIQHRSKSVDKNKITKNRKALEQMLKAFLDSHGMPIS